MTTNSADFLKSETEDDIRDRWFIINKDHVFIKYWELFIIFLAIYNTITVPLTFAFEIEFKDLFNNPDRFGE